MLWFSASEMLERWEMRLEVPELVDSVSSVLRSFVAQAFSAISILMSPSSLKMNALKSFPAMGAQLL